MAMRFEELNPTTRASMLREFEQEEAGNPYRSRHLTSAGLAAFPGLMRDALQSGNEESLLGALLVRRYWKSYETCERSGQMHTREVNPRHAAERLAVTEFNTWYVRGFAAVLREEGVTQCVVYRAGMPRRGSGSCCAWEGRVVSVEAVYQGHRATYWPRPNPGAFSIPFGPDCHHTIRRVSC